MGPLASLAFLRTVYDYNRSDGPEQGYPDVILHSISSTPDRTGSLMASSQQALLDSLLESLQVLAATGVDRMVVCCMTAHSVFDQLPEEISAKLISLVDVAAHLIEASPEPPLLLATKGSYQHQVLHSTAAGKAVADRLLVPDDSDKVRVHEVIYNVLKTGRDPVTAYDLLRELLAKYRVGSFVAGCTEIHILVRYLLSEGVTDISPVDPALHVAQNLEALLHESS
jgi:aspartate racemase